MMAPTDEPEVCVSGGEPIDRQIYEQIRTCILAGQLQPGEQLPSQRGLAVELAVNPETVQRAYEQLEHDGLVSTADGSGVRVTASALAEHDPARWRVLEQLCADFLAQAAQLGFSPDEVLAAAWKQRRERSW